MKSSKSGSSQKSPDSDSKSRKRSNSSSSFKSSTQDNHSSNEIAETSSSKVKLKSSPNKSSQETDSRSISKADSSSKKTSSNNDKDNVDTEVRILTTPQHTEYLKMVEKLDETYQKLADETSSSDDQDDSSDKVNLNSSTESSESEDESGELAGKIAAEFMDILPKIAARDPTIYDTSKTFFPTAIEVEEDDSEDESEKEKPKTLTYSEMASQAMLNTSEEDSGDEITRMDETEIAKSTKSKSYVQQQAELKKELLEAVWTKDSDESSEDELFSVKTQTEEEKSKFENEYEQFLSKQQASSSSDVLSSFWTRSDLSKEDQFLRDFILKKYWVSRGEDGEDETGEELPDMALYDEEDATIDLKEDNLEAVYNFRFEDPHGSSLISHSRHQPDSVRSAGLSKRSLRRARVAERKKQAELAAQEEKIQSKKAKKSEILASLSELREKTQREPDLDSSPLDSKDQDDSEVDDTELGEIDQIVEAEKWLEAYKQKYSKKSNKDKGQNDDSVALQAEDLLKQIDEYYKLDYEDMIGDEKVRFGYTEVPKSDYGLSAVDILNMSDDELDRYVPIRKLHTYREDSGLMSKQELKKRMARAKRSKELHPESKKSKKDRKRKESKDKKRKDLIESKHHTSSKTQKQELEVKSEHRSKKRKQPDTETDFETFSPSKKKSKKE